jgi:hypothetical protein
MPNRASSLATVLNPDGTLRPEATSSFNVQGFALATLPTGQPLFRPASTTGTGDERWQNGFSLPNGTNGKVYAMVRVGSAIYIGGNFSLVANVAARNVAKWDGTAWSALGTGTANGTDNVVLALAVAANGDVYAGGSFRQAGGLVANSIAKWNGAVWSAVGANSGGTDTVLALATAPNGDVYAGGTFTQLGGVPASHIARWNGSSWSALGAGTSVWPGAGGTDEVDCLAVAANGDVYAGGGFTQAGTVSADHIARWNGSAWSSVGTGIGPGSGGGYSVVKTLKIADNGNVYAGGSFGRAGGTGARGIARWNGSEWTALGTGVGGANGAEYVATLAFATNGDVYAGGNFLTAGGAPATGIVRWNGSIWTPMGSNAPTYVNYNVFALAVAGNGDLYAGGDFAQIGGVAASTVAHWNGTGWKTLGLGFGNGIYGTITALVVAPNGDVFAAGTFTTAGQAQPGNVARWDGTTWTALGTGFNGDVLALAVAGNGDLYVGGNFTAVDAVPARNVARWNGTAWTALGNGVGFITGRSDLVFALAVAANGDVYAGGDFTTVNGAPASGVARWNGSAWNALGKGLDTPNSFYYVNALALASNGDLYVGGLFSTVGGIAANSVARWNGSTWNALGAGVNNGLPAQVGALTVAPNGNVYAGGSFSSGVSRWDGTSWTDLGGVGSRVIGSVTALRLAGNGDVYAGGSFSAIGGAAANNVARWNGSSWAVLGTGLNAEIRALAIGKNNMLYAGGAFTTVGDGSKMTVGFAGYDPQAPLATAIAAQLSAVLTLYPNPAHSTVTLIVSAAAQPRALCVLDASGREVRCQQLPAHSTKATLDVRSLAPGLYVVRCGLALSKLLVE